MILPRFFSASEKQGKEGAGYIECGLCPRRCLLAPDGMGQCKARFNGRGKPELPYYGFITATAMDPIEKKPLYHFRPGTEIMSIGFVGCNLRCPFCQNWHISQSTNTDGKNCSPQEIVTAALKAGRAGQKAAIAYTYSEPLVHIEFLLDCMKKAREAGVVNVLVSNGCVNRDAAGEILRLTDAAKIDLKCFSEEIYKNILGGDLAAVTDFIRMAAEKEVHTEVTTLVVPGLNDSRAELDRCRDFIAELQIGRSGVPWHLSAYHPSYKWDTPATDPRFLTRAAERAGEKLAFVYTGNIAPQNGERRFTDTFCPGCGKPLISRKGYRVDTSGLSLKEWDGSPIYYCASCGKKAPVRC